MEVTNYKVSKLVYNLFTGLTTYTYIGVVIHLLNTMDITADYEKNLLAMIWCEENRCSKKYQKVCSQKFTHRQRIYGTTV